MSKFAKETVDEKTLSTSLHSFFLGPGDQKEHFKQKWIWTQKLNEF